MIGENTTAALETSVTNTHRGKKDENKRMIKDFETKLRHDVKKIEDLIKNALQYEIENSQYAKQIQFQGIPEKRSESLQQVLFDTGVRVHPLEIDEVYREGKFNKKRARPE